MAVVCVASQIEPLEACLAGHLSQTFHYNIHQCLSQVPFLSQMSSVHTLSIWLFKGDFNLILPSVPSSSNWFSGQNVFVYFPSPFLAHAPSSPSHPCLFYYPNNIKRRIKIMKHITVIFTLFCKHYQSTMVVLN